jgi:tetratricopeptide (TPR) repeat protein
MDGELVAIPQKLKRKKATTSSTAMVGTLPFMAPELFTSLKAASLKTDIYSFGIVLYNMLTGINPFNVEDPAEIIANHVSLVPEDPRMFNEHIPERFVALIYRCLEKDPDERFLDFSEIQAELEEIYYETTDRKYTQPREEHHFTEEDWLNKGLSLASLNRHREAIITFDQAMQMNPGSLRARIYKGYSLLNFGKILESITCLDEGMKIDPQNWELWFYRGESHWKLGKLDEALSCFEHALTLTSEQSAILGRKGALLVERGDLKEALGCYNQALSQNPRAAEIWDAKGSLQIMMKHYESAANCLKEALEINPRSRTAWFHQGVALFNLGCFREAIEAHQKALAIAPGFVDAWLGIGDCYRESGEGEKALGAFRSALTIEPENIEAYFSSIQLLKEKSRWEDALKFIDQALEIYPDNTRLFTERAETLLHLGSYEDALSLCQVILDIEPENEDARFLMKSLTRWSGEQEEIMKKLHSLTSSSGERSYESLNDILCTFCNVNDAIACMQQSEPTSAEGCWLMASLYYIDGLYEKAHHYLERAGKEPDFLYKTLPLRDLIGDRMESRKSPSGRRKLSIDSLVKKISRNDHKAELLLIHGLEKLQEAQYSDARAAFNEALGLDDRCHACFFFIGKACELEGKHERAQEYYQQFLDQVPHSRGYWKEKLSRPTAAAPPEKEGSFMAWAGNSFHDHLPWCAYILYLARNKYYEKMKLLASTLLKLPDHPWKDDDRSPLGLNVKGLLQLLLGRYEEAQKSFEEALALDAQSSTALLGLGRCCQSREEKEKAEEYYRTLVASPGASEAASYLLADISLSRAMDGAALQSVEEALKKSPRSLMLMFKKSHILVSTRHYNEFLSYYSRAYDINPHYVPIRTLRSLTLLELQKHDDAVLELTNVMNLAPDNILVAENLCYQYLQSGNMQKALPVFDRLISYYPLNFELHKGKGITCYLLKNFPEARECFREALILNPTEPDLWQFMAAVNYHLLDYEESLKCWDKAIKSKSRFVQAWTNRGVLHYEQKEYIQAQECVDKTLRIEPENSFAWLYRSQCMWKLGKMREAMKNVERALSHSPYLLKGWALKGTLEFYQHAYESSLQSFDRATQLDNKRHELWYNRALAALCLNNFVEAKKSLDRALALNQTMVEAYIARFVLSRNSDDNAPRHTFLAQAQYMNPVRFDEWAQEYQNRRDPLTPLKPLDMQDDPFSLPLIRAFAIIEPLEVFDFLS